MRPRRLFIDEKTNRAYYIINKKKVFVKVPKGVSLKQIQKVNIKNIIQVPKAKRVKRRNKRIKPQFQQRLVSSMAPGVLPSSGGLPTYVFQEKKPVQSIEDVQKAFVKNEPKLLKDAEIVPQNQKLVIEGSLPPRPQIPRVESIDFSSGKPSIASSIASSRAPTPPTSPRPLGAFRRTTEKTRLSDKDIIELRKIQVEEEEARKEENIRKMFEKPVGKGSGMGEEGLYDNEVEKIASKRLKYFVPCIASDETDQLMKYVKRGDKEFAFVINTDPSGTPGRHWTCVYIDNRDDYPSMEFFDPLAEGTPPKAVIDVMRKIASKMNPEKMFKYKYNIIRRQSTRTNNCGHHCIKFLEDRYNGIPFCEASGYDDFIDQNKDKLMGADGSVLGEGEVLKMMPKYNSYI